MMHEFIENDDGTTTIKVDFMDEGVDLVGETSVKGNKTSASTYLSTYEADLRRNNIELFPISEMPVAAEGGLQ